MLLIHGSANPANPNQACAALALSWRAAGLRVRHEVIEEAGYAWDHRPVGPTHAERVPRPDGPLRVLASPWAAAAEHVAREAAIFLAEALGRGP